MANITPTPDWSPVRQLETTDRVLAGPEGVANAQAIALANQTLLLRRSGGAMPFLPGVPYQIGDRVRLDDGGEVISDEDGNTQDPNVGLSGWRRPSVSEIYDESGLSQQKWNDGVESIADLLATPNPKSDSRVYVKSYHKATNFALAQPFKGGGVFLYVQTLSTVNNGVTVFNGWVRDTSNKILTTDDAGLLGDGTDTNTTVRLQNLFSAVDDGFTIKVIGKYTINRHVMAYNKKDLKIVGVNSDIQGDPDDWTWSTTNVVPDVPWYHPRGMLMAYECPNVHFDNFNIKGINRPNLHAGADQWEDGDCSIMTYRCHDSLFTNNICTNNFAWGICNENGINGEAYGNIVSHCTHQSGINLSNGADAGIAKIHGNTVSECGLYGVEYENRNTYTIECQDNITRNCYAGLMALSDNQAISGKIHNNTATECFYGIYPTRLLSEQNDLLVSLNTVKDSEYAINLSTGSGINLKDNVLHGFYSKDTFLHISPATFVAEVLASNRFLVHKSLVLEFGAVVGSVYYVNGQQITINALTVNTAPWSYGNVTPSNFYVITIAESILNADFLFKHLKKKYNANARCYMGINDLGSNKNNLISDNTVTGFAYGFVKDAASTDPAYNETIIDNTFIDGAVDILNPAASLGVKYINNTLTSNINVNRDLVEGGNLSLTPFITTKLGVALSTASGTPPTATVFSPSAEKIQAVSIGLVGASATTGNLVVVINGTTFTAKNTGSSAVIIATQNRTLSLGNNSIQVKSTVADLTYTDVNISLLTA